MRVEEGGEAGWGVVVSCVDGRCGKGGLYAVLSAACWGERSLSKSHWPPE